MLEHHSPNRDKAAARQECLTLDAVQCSCRGVLSCASPLHQLYHLPVAHRLPWLSFCRRKSLDKLRSKADEAQQQSSAASSSKKSTTRAIRYRAFSWVVLRAHSFDLRLA